ncbi:hypothetical protein NDU88_006519 [Pleurodeles waltl]|uniref:Uncharacterized protein n=1 Tax=Pleurodeles waltl TaxID=8319 RepID=A0AAV7MZG5_PLEWA|nr:hypothetical protein NDU88_006519 [Pleurodeles waltl]
MFQPSRARSVTGTKAPEDLTRRDRRVFGWTGDLTGTSWAPHDPTNIALALYALIADSGDLPVKLLLKQIIVPVL